MSDKTFMLPGGRIAVSEFAEYYKAWRELAEPLEKALNIRMRAFDPDCAFITQTRETFELPVSVVEAYNKLYHAANELQEAVSSIDGFEDVVGKVQDALVDNRYQADVCPNCDVQMGQKFGGTAVPTPCKKCGKMCCSRCVLRRKKDEYLCKDCYQKVSKNVDKDIQDK